MAGYAVDNNCLGAGVEPLFINQSPCAVIENRTGKHKMRYDFSLIPPKLPVDLRTTNTEFIFHIPCKPA